MSTWPMPSAPWGAKTWREPTRLACGSWPRRCACLPASPTRLSASRLIVSQTINWVDPGGRPRRPDGGQKGHEHRDDPHRQKLQRVNLDRQVVDHIDARVQAQVDILDEEADR